MKQATSLEQLTELWREDLPPSFEDQTFGLNRVRWRNKAWLMVESLVAAVGCAVGLVLIGAQQLQIGAATIAFSLVGLTATLVTRARFAHRLTRPVANALQLSLVEAKAKFRVAIGGICVCVAALFFIATVFFTAESTPDWRAFTAFLILASAALLWSVNEARRWYRKYQRLKTTDAALNR